MTAPGQPTRPLRPRGEAGSPSGPRPRLVGRGQESNRVGENAGLELDEAGGIRIVIAAETPEGVPEENWLPMERRDVDLNLILRLYSPDLEAFASWTPPRARKL